MSSYNEKLLINCVHADPGSCMCMIYFLDSKCDTFSRLANTHDPENRSQKLNKIHRRRLSHWHCHTDSLTFVAISRHCHQALAMINNATNDSLANWIVLWTPILLCWSKHWGYSFCGYFRCEMVVEWQIYVYPDNIFCHSDGCKKVKKAHYWTTEPVSKFETIINTAKAKTRSWFPFMDQGIGL